MFRAPVRLVMVFALAMPLMAHAHGAGRDQAQPSGKKAAAARPKAASKKMTDAQKIRSAMSAAPAEISKNAAIMDWPDSADGKPRQLRAGTNGWVCYPSTMQTAAGAASGEDPMCLDKAWQQWAEAYMSKKDPPSGNSGIAYMLRGDKGASNTDPFAMGPAAGNQWVTSPPHVMVLVADSKALDAYATDPNNGGPWVMWKGTPYAHLMVPVSPTRAATMAGK